MHSTTFLTTLLAAATSTTALQITLYTNTNYGGDSTTISLISGSCTDAGQYNDKVSSVKMYGASCTLFENYGCSGGQFKINGDTPSLEGVFNDKMSSVTCY
ncbi:hypothetical protein K458DRAFT_484774 [Lentithecium fluviatile CBS 122367]|uniref:Uncharacterized protein n=1 Tax=Lentithecium fluviatile CBS 122367 TaxID=1168545 RepID=A0A6G1JF50_9PLEO|nr:hypothetical protein K458DRAFT_484774 [Lentithecium fluviatile CBS 122367]